MQRVATKEIKLADYRDIVSGQLLAQISEVAAKLKGLRIVQANATPIGGGVAEILKSLVPMMRSVGIEADWYAVEPDEPFFRVSKALHHCLQGDSRELSREELELYLAHNERSATALAMMQVTADIWIIHDVQLLPLLRCLDTASPGVWVCHIDATEPDEVVREMLTPYMEDYRKIVVSMPEYHLDSADQLRIAVFPPAIDPLSPKNIPLPRHQARELLAQFGINPRRPLVSQVSRFDRWKDPWGVIDAYRLAKEEIPKLQLALVGVMTAKDDSDASEVFADIQQYARCDPDIHLFSNALLVGDREIDAFQSGSDVIVQKSIREGFGLTVAEAMWKATPVVGGDCGGIRRQICDGVNGFLVTDVPSCAGRLIALLKDQALSKALGDAGKESVRRDYLMPRLLKDYLDLLLELINGKGVNSTAQNQHTACDPPREEPARLLIQ